MFPYGKTQSSIMPAPEVIVNVSSPMDGTKRTDVMFVVDTGAAVSLLPTNILERLGPLECSPCSVNWGNGITMKHMRYLVVLSVNDVTFEPIWVVATEKKYGLLGRDILNRHLLTCDGPQQTWTTEPAWL
jgi:predicted aspartyl protease